MKSEDIKSRLGENLKAIRKSYKLTQFELAEKANVSEDTIKSIELSRFWPSEKTLAQISEALNMDIYHLFLPTPKTINGNLELEDELKKVILQKYSEYIDSVLKDLRVLT